MNKPTTIRSAVVEGRKLVIISELDLDQLKEEYIPYYELKRDIQNAVAPIIIEEILKDKKKIIAECLKNVNWPDIVRAEVAQKVIREIAKDY